MPLKDMVRILVNNFQKRYSVTAEMLEDYIGCKKEAFSQQSVVRLKNVYNLQDSSARAEQYFDMSLTAPEAKEPTEKSASAQAG